MARSNDIEDVLTSIRRLVAADAPRLATASAPDRALVLDQARRVSDPDAPFRAIGPLPQAPAIDFPAEEEDEPAQDRGTPEETAEAAPLTSAPVTPLPQRPRLEPLAVADMRTDREDSEGAEPVAVDLADLGEAALGDEALRRLIEDVVRQELSGALGERITRNVRKLVRRELRRVLSDDGFD